MRLNTNNTYHYIQASLQARHGTRPTEDAWQYLESFTDLASYLQVARRTSLRPWVLSLHANDDHHVIEDTLLNAYRLYIDDIARWQPKPWQASVLWLKRLVDLPAVNHLLRGNTAPVWMFNDAYLKRFTHTNMEQRLNSLQDSDLAPLLDYWRRGEPLLLGWVEQWRSHWPALNKNMAEPLQQLIDLVIQHIDDFSVANVKSAWPLREKLSHRLCILFRRYTNQPSTSFVHLGLVGLDLERLRAALIHRCVLSEIKREVV